jgi:hypothetical protein
MDWDYLTTTVPAAIHAAAGWPPEQLVNEADYCAGVIASGADLLRADPAAKPHTGFTAGQVREAISTGLGILALRPGGVGFAGRHWHASPTRCAACPGPGTLPLFTGPGPLAAAGAVFTPRSLADDVVANALGVIIQPSSMSPAADIEDLRIADPFCGSGAFLAAAARYLGDALAAAWDDRDQAEIRNLCTLYGTADPVMAARAFVITHCLHGVDLDPGSVELAGLALQLLAPECATDHVLAVDEDDYARHVAGPATPGELARRARLARQPGPPTARLPGLKTGDALVGQLRSPGPADYPAGAARLDWPAAFPEVFDAHGGFDAVIGNPPFLGGYKITGVCGQAYREHLITAVAAGKRTIADLAVYCWLRAHQLANANGVTGFIGPDSMLRGANLRLATELLSQDGWRPYRQVRRLRWPSRSAAVSVCTVWTHQWDGADPPQQLRNQPESAPPTGQQGTFWRTVEINGTQVDLDHYTPVARGGQVQAALFPAGTVSA